VETVEKSLRHSTGRNLPDKRFCYLRTVRVTAAVCFGLYAERKPINFTKKHRAGVRPYTSCYHLAESCVFGKQSALLILCHLNWPPFSQSYGVNLPSSFTMILSCALVHLYLSTSYSFSTVFFRSFS